jgi:acetyltransferase-like isoleucine patch superfamily enzyme
MAFLSTCKLRLGRFLQLAKVFSTVLNNQLSPRPIDLYISDGTYTFGRFTYGSPRILKYPGDQNKVIVGSFCSIANSVTIFVGGNHNVRNVSTFPLLSKLEIDENVPLSNGDVVIGSDVWLGYGCTILSGVNIEHGAVVGAMAVVTKDVPPYGIVVGNPARLVRKRFSDDQIQRLLKIAWWDWPISKIKHNAHLLNSELVDDFIECHIDVTSTFSR